MAFSKVANFFLKKNIVKPAINSNVNIDSDTQISSDCYIGPFNSIGSKSIIGKLSREGVYQRAIYKSKTGEAPVTKVELVTNIAENLGIEIEYLVGLDKSPKAALKALEVATGAQSD